MSMFKWREVVNIVGLVEFDDIVECFYPLHFRRNMRHWLKQCIVISSKFPVSLLSSIVTQTHNPHYVTKSLKSFAEHR